MTYLSKIPVKNYRKNIIIEKKNHLYYATSTLYESKNEVNKALSIYKKVFPDAFVVGVEQVNALDAKHLLENKTVYLCKEARSKRSKKEMIRLDFTKEYVLYRKLSKAVPPLEIAYTFDKDSVILTMSGMQFRYLISKEEDGFLLAQSFINDKKGQSFRYYFDKNLALDFADTTFVNSKAKTQHSDQTQN